LRWNRIIKAYLEVEDVYYYFHTENDKKCICFALNANYSAVNLLYLLRDFKRKTTFIKLCIFTYRNVKTQKFLNSNLNLRYLYKWNEYVSAYSYMLAYYLPSSIAICTRVCYTVANPTLPSPLNSCISAQSSPILISIHCFSLFQLLFSLLSGSLISDTLKRHPTDIYA
jgi:hypothetical protein